MKNKALRQEIKTRKYHRRVKLYSMDKVTDGIVPNTNALRTTGNPCNCWMYKGEHYNRKHKHRISLQRLLATD